MLLQQQQRVLFLPHKWSSLWQWIARHCSVICRAMELTRGSKEPPPSPMDFPIGADKFVYPSAKLDTFLDRLANRDESCLGGLTQLLG